MNNQQETEKTCVGIGKALGMLLDSAFEDDLACLQALKEHGVITTAEYQELVARVNAKK